MDASAPQTGPYRDQIVRGLSSLADDAYAALARLVGLAQTLCEVPIASVCLVDSTHQRVIASSGWDVPDVPRDHALCTSVVRTGDLTVYEDVRRVGRFPSAPVAWEPPPVTMYGGSVVAADGHVLAIDDVWAGSAFARDPMVHAPPRLRFFAGAPVTLADGVRVGGLCIGAPEPRTLTASQRDHLAALADQAAHLLDTHRSLQEVGDVHDAVAEAHDAVIITEDGTDHETPWRAVWMNPAFSDLTGYSAAETLGRTAPMFRAEHIDAEVRAKLERALADENPVTVETTLYTNANRGISVGWSLAPVQREEGGGTRWISILRDVTDAQIREERLQYKASHDSLTTLLNRDSFTEWLHSIVTPRPQAAADEAPSSLNAVVYYDLNGFKAVNDTYGHHCGDQLLIEFADMLDASVREADKVARMGGDEFAVGLVDLADPETAQRVAERTCRATTRTIDLQGRSVEMAVSAGLIVGLTSHETVDALLRAADQAMYTAKRRVQDGSALYNATTDTLTPLNAPVAAAA